jgi:hypothetical protein
LALASLARLGPFLGLADTHRRRLAVLVAGGSRLLVAGGSWLLVAGGSRLTGGDGGRYFLAS